MNVVSSIEEQVQGQKNVQADMQVQYSGKSARGRTRRLTTEVRQPLTECSWGDRLVRRIVGRKRFSA